MSDNVWDEVLARWAADEKFRVAMRENPRRALETVFGVQISDDVKIVLHSPSSPKELHLVMPPPMTNDLNDVHSVNDGRKTTLACMTQVRGGTCWNTPNCPTLNTCRTAPC
jgi:hypothetical protein